MKRRFCTAAVLIETLSAPEARSVRTSSMVRTPPPTVSGMKQASAVRRTTSRRIARSSWLAVMSRKQSSSAPAASYAFAASTGSPASRNSTKRTPLTTRPSFTSRQGITRTLNISVPRGAHEGKGLFRIEPAVIKRAAGDGAFEFFRARLQQRLHVVDGREAAGRDHRNGNALGERNRRIQIEALHHAVALDIGVDDGGDALVLEHARELHRLELGFLGPAGNRDLARPRVDAHRDLAGKFLRRGPHEIRIAHGGGADHDAGDALGEPAFDRRDVADAAAELHRNLDRLADRGDDARVHGLAGKGAVEVDEVQPFEARRLEALRLRHRIAVEDGGAGHVAPFEPHHLAVLEIDCRKEDHGFQRRKFASSASPSRWLFSGWN